MSVEINQKCVGCFACYNVCPNRAIAYDQEQHPNFRVHTTRCNQCNGQFDKPQCGEICPVEQAISLNGSPINATGSLTPHIDIKEAHHAHC
ncbi:4Fe-4S dicluster domain-containing protein [Vibrio agarivorans]|uniref:4Fe-4S dicluster domain-containing protein n=1 Tax=Vibrio agarivorans TaxID=153622 RepID=UPI00222F29BD|nr:4Fe-4S dicluster domain-containing protein [Vibrio agarivorans]MDN3663408.1 4Fe-4S dicluster domain-containing protein [Vibrio agarivorans]